MSVICTECKGPTEVIDSRTISDGLVIRRRRRCLNKKCEERFTTIESVVPEGTRLPTMLREQQRAFKLLAQIRKIINSRKPL